VQVALAGARVRRAGRDRQRGSGAGSVSPSEEGSMNLVYNSANYYVLEYPAHRGYELVDKQAGRGAFLHGEMARRLRDWMQDAAREDPSVERIDEVLENFQPLLTTPVVAH
jgi:hypothetical protein